MGEKAEKKRDFNRSMAQRVHGSLLGSTQEMFLFYSRLYNPLAFMINETNCRDYTPLQGSIFFISHFQVEESRARRGTKAGYGMRRRG